MSTQSQTIGAMEAAGGYSIWRVIMASSVGTMIEWYDFYIFGSLAAILALSFIHPATTRSPTLPTWPPSRSAFWCGLLARCSLAASAIWSAGKYAFLVTLSIMGFSTFAIGLLPSYRHRRMVCADRAASDPRPARTGAGRRIRRRGSLCRRACSRQQARLLHQLHPDHGHAGPFRFADRDSGDAELDVERRFRRLWLAHSVPDLHHPGDDLALHSPEDERVAHLRGAQGHGHDLRAAV